VVAVLRTLCIVSLTTDTGFSLDPRQSIQTFRQIMEDEKELPLSIEDIIVLESVGGRVEKFREGRIGRKIISRTMRLVVFFESVLSMAR
jgi:hypothetical protein